MKLLNIGRYGDFDMPYTTLFVGSENSPEPEEMIQYLKYKFNNDSRVNSIDKSYIGAYRFEDTIEKEIVAILTEKGYTKLKPAELYIGD